MAPAHIPSISLAPLLRQIEKATAGGRATPAWYQRIISADPVVEQEFLALRNLSQADEPDVASRNPCIEVWLAAVVDVFRAAAPDGPVQRKSLIDPK